MGLVRSSFGYLLKSTNGMSKGKLKIGRRVAREGARDDAETARWLPGYL